MSPKMAREYPCKQIYQSGKEQEPGSQKMETSSPTVLIKNFIGATCADHRPGLIVKGGGLFPTPMAVVSANGQFEQGRRKIISYLAPVEPWVAHKYHKSAKDKGKKTHRDDPMGAFYPSFMSNVLRC